MYAQTVPDKGGVKPTVLSLPSGPGSIEGLGKSFQPQLNTGSATYTVPLTLPAGPTGFSPALALAYDSGFGNGPLGRGWRLEGPLAIERQTDKGFARYRDTDGGDGARRDVFVFEGEELVALSDGTYRLENDEAFRRFSPISGRVGGPVEGWLVEDRDGVRHWLGRYGGGSEGAASRIVNPELEDQSPFESTFRWLEDAAEDVHGNRIEYRYQADGESPGVLYLARVAWRAAGATAYHVVELRTEARTDRLSDYRSGFERSWARRYREISIGSYFDGERRPVRAYELSYDRNTGAQPADAVDAAEIPLGVSALHAIARFGSDRGWGGTGESGTPLPATRFAYTWMTLQSAGAAGARRSAALGFRRQRHEPVPVAAGPVIGQLLQESASGPRRLFDVLVDDRRGRVQFADVDGDGLVDILDTRVDDGKRRYTWARNVGGGRFWAGRAMMTPDGADLGQDSDGNQTFLSDADGDGMVDLKRIVGERDQRRTLIYRNVAAGARDGERGFSDPVVAGGTPLDVDTTDPDARQIDLDFDKIPDLLRSSSRGLSGYVADAEGRWRRDDRSFGTREMLRDYRFSMDGPGGRRRRHPLVQLADMNGDRLLDLVRIIVRSRGEAVVGYRPMTGPMRWGREVVFNFADRNGVVGDTVAVLRLPGIEPRRLDPRNQWDAVQVIDANGDGLSDVVFVEPAGSVRVFFNVHGRGFSEPHVVRGTPRYLPADRRNPTLLRTVDINGNGSVDLVFFHSSGGPGVEGFRYLDFMGGQKSGLLQVVDNGVGLRSYVRYKPAVVDQIAAQETGAPWTSVSPVPTWVVSGIVDDVGLDFDLDGDSDRYATTFRYRDPHYDGSEKQFRGFRFVQQIEWGDDVDPGSGLPSAEEPAGGHRTTVTRFRFHTGEPDGVDNDEYLDGFDTERRPAARVFDERTTFGGREEEALKGKPLLQEIVHPLALRDASADFDACARRLMARSEQSDRAAVCTPDRYVYRREVSVWRIRRLYRPAGVVAPKGRLLRREPRTIALGDASVSFPVRSAVETTVPEANGVLRDAGAHPAVPVPTAEPVRLRTEFEYDDYGNQTLERQWGIISGRDPPVDDERVVETTFVLPRGPGGRVEPWILDRPATRRVEDENGRFASEVRYYYDGDRFVGLPLGRLGGRGLMSRRERRVSDRSPEAPPLPPLAWIPADVADPLPDPGDPRLTTPEWLVEERAAYDDAGNKTVQADGLARLAANGELDSEAGHVTLTRFDPVFRTFPVEERLRVGNGRPDLVFRAAYVSPETDYAAAMHWGHGVMTRSWNANGHQTDYLYDRHGRLTAVVAPGDTGELPTVVHTYRPADPHRGLRYDYDRSGRLLPAGGGVPVLVDQAANAVVTDRREVSGEPRVLRSITFTTGGGVEVLRLEEDRDGYAAVQALRPGLRGTTVFEAQPYRQPTDNFRIPERDTIGTDLWRDPLDRVTRRRLPPESAEAPSRRLEARVHHLPLAEWRFDEEDLAAADPARDHRGTPLVLQWDGLERLVDVMEHVKGDNTVEAWRTSYVHDLNDKLSGILDSQSNLRVMRHDGLGRRIALHDVNRGLLRFSFDAAHNVVETLDAKGQRITYGHDGLNRLISEDYHDTGRSFSSGRDYDPQRPMSDVNRPDVLYTYDSPVGPVDLGDGRTVLSANALGFLVSVSDLSGEEHLSYDDRGRVAWEVKRIGSAGDPAAGYLTTMMHDAADRLIGIGYPDGTRVVYEYDARGRTRRIDSPQLGVIVAEQTHTAAGLPADTTLGNGVHTSRKYDPRLRPTTIVTGPGTGAVPFLDYRYHYDGASNVLQIDDRRPEPVRARRFDNSQRFVYDDLYRVTGAAYDTGRLSLTYDRTGNLTERRFVAATGSGASDISTPGTIRYGGPAGSGDRIGRFDEAPGPQAPSGDGNGRAYRYDANGNLTQLGDMILTWDFKDRLVAVETPSVRAEYGYDYTGRRITKTVWNGASPHRSSPTETHYVSSHFQVVGGAAQRYVFDGDTRLARVSVGGDLVFYHRDLVGSTDVLTDAAGALIQSNAFLPFGGVRARYDAPRATSEATVPEYLFHQKERDLETGMLYFEARYLDAGLGRFIRVDPAIVALPAGALETPQLLNGYSFAANNPLRYGDSSGEWTVQIGIPFSLNFGRFGVSVYGGTGEYFVFDSEGNYGTLSLNEFGSSVGIGGEAVGAFTVGVSTARTIHDLQGTGASNMTTVTTPKLVGGTGGFFGNKDYLGVEAGVALGVPGASNTKAITEATVTPGGNIFEDLKSLWPGATPPSGLGPLLPQYLPSAPSIPPEHPPVTPPLLPESSSIAPPLM